MPKHKPVDPFVAEVAARLAGLAGYRSRAMFGGHGLYAGGRIFGLIAHGRLYFKTDDASRPAYTAAGMDCFYPEPGKPMRAYLEVPPGVWNDPPELIRWAERAAEVGQ